MRSSTPFRLATATTVALAGFAAAQTDDTIWHNRYHAVLAMAAYGDYENLCPSQTFTERAMRQNFPNTDLPAWEIIETFGPTAHGAQGFTVLIPEMDKVVAVWTGNYSLESSLPTAVTSFDALGLGEGVCSGCSVNEFALQGYLEARAETDNWALSRARYEATGLQYSITGHGLGGMHALIQSIDLGWAGVCRWSHNYGTPRTFNQAGADFYDRLFQGEAGERGVANNDRFVELIPASEDYAFTGTAFLYSGYDPETHMNMTACWDQPNSAACAPIRPLDEESHYFYFVNVGQCGGNNRVDNATVRSYVSSVSQAHYATATSAPFNGSAATSTPSANLTSTIVNLTSTALSTSTSTSAPTVSLTSTSSSGSVSGTGIGGNAALASGSPSESAVDSGAGYTTKHVSFLTIAGTLLAAAVGAVVV